jgi:WD40 repeat protein
VGGGLLSEAVIRAWDRLRSHGRPDAGQTDLRDALAAELEAGLTLDTAAAAALRDEVADVLQEVEAVQVALTATVEESAAGVREVLVRGLRELGEEFTEFRWVLDEVNQQLTVIAEDVAQTAATTREVADNQQQTLVELAMLRQEARSAFRYRASRLAPAVSAGASADEERAAALDAAGVAVSPQCPYLGLAAFQPSDAERFFGREQLTAELVARAGEQLARPGLLMVLGPSGSGKSSLLRAGFLPAVAAGALPARGSWAWPRDLMTPGRRPLLELATRIASLAGVPAGALEADLRTDPARITGAIRQALLANARRQQNMPGPPLAASPVVIDLDVGQQAEEPDAGSPTTARQAAAGPRLVLIVDQFEEVFTQCADEQERRAFIKSLCAAAGTAASGITADGGPGRGHVDAREAPALVAIGIRADFYARTTAYPELVPHLQDHQVLVGPIDEAGLREAIEKPAAKAGLVPEAALVEVLLADLGLHAHQDAPPTSTVKEPAAGAAVTGWDSYAAGRLALLSYALQQTWRNREGRQLTVAGYRATGGIDGAVAQAADNVYDRLDAAGRDALQRVLLRLVTLGEGTPDTRRRVDLAELTGSGESERDAAARAVLADLIAARLVTADADMAEITHETLLTAWPRLRQWLIEDRAGLRIHRDLTDAAHDWQQEGRDPGRLFRGTRLVVARDWAARHGQDLNDDERAFLASSQHDQLRTTRLRRAAVAALAVLTVVAVILAVGALVLRGQAVGERNQAIIHQVTAEAEQLQSTNPSLAAQLDLVVHRLDPNLDNTSALLGTTSIPLSNPLTGHTGPVFNAAFSPDGRTLATGSADGTIRLWNVTDSAHPTAIGQPIAAHNGFYAFSPDGRILAAGGGPGTIRLWNLTDPAHATAIGQPFSGRASPIRSAAFSPDGHILAAGSADGTIRLWNVTDPAHAIPIGPPLTGLNATSGVWSVAFSPDGHMLAAGTNDDTIRLWNVSDPAHVIPIGQPLTGPTGPVYSVAFSPGGNTLAAGSGGDDTIRLWNVSDPAHVIPIGQPLTGPTNTVSSVAFSPGGNTLAAASQDGTIRLWNVTDPADATPIGQPFTGHNGPVYSVAFSPGGNTLAAGSGDGTTRLWSLPSTVLTGQTSTINSVAFSPGGNTLATGSGDGTIRLWNVINPAHPTPEGEPLAGFIGSVDSVAFSPGGNTLATGSYGDKIQLWNVTDPADATPIGQPLTGPAGPVYSVAFSLDGRILAAGSADGTIRLWNVTNPARATPIGQPFTGHNGPIYAVAFSPDGNSLAVGNFDDTIRLWNVTDPARPAPLGPPLVGHTNNVFSVAFSPDGRILAAGSADDTIRLWNVSDPARPDSLGQPLTGPTNAVEAVAFSPDGRILAAGSGDGTIRLWNVTDPAHATAIGQPLTDASPVFSAAFSPNGHTLAAGSGNGTTQLWNLNVGQAIDRICATTSDNLTPQQWARYVSQLPYNPPCRHL